MFRTSALLRSELGRCVGRRRGRGVLVAAAATLAIALSAPAAIAATSVGSLDPAFGTGGFVVKQYGASSTPLSEFTSAAAVLGGRVVVTGIANDSGGNGRAITLEFDNRGQHVSGFAGGVSAPTFPVTLVPYVAVDSKGGVVVAATATDNGGIHEITIHRYLPNGAVDTGFGNGGTVNDQLSTVTSQPNGTEVDGIGIDPQDRIVVTGTVMVPTMSSPTLETYVARFTASGHPDTTFSGGVYEHLFGASSGAGKPLVNSDGSVDVPVSEFDGHEHWGVLALDTNGHPVAGFGTTGASFDTRTDYEATTATSVARLRNGDLLVAGSEQPTSASALAAEAFNGSSGAVDTAFATSGIYTGPADAVAEGVVVQPNGLIDLAGNEGSSQPVPLVVELNGSGMPNPGFGSAGIATYPINGQSGGANSAVLDTGGRLFFAGLAVVAGVPPTFETVVGQVIVHLPPVPTITGAPARADAAQPIALKGSATDPDGTVSSYAWDLHGAGTFKDATGPTATVAFNAPGVHTVALKVTDDDDVSAVATASIDVLASARQPRLRKHHLVVRGGAIPVKLSCPSGRLPCNGQLTLVTSNHGAAPKLKLGGGLSLGHAGVVLGQSRYSINPGRATTIDVPLSNKGRKLIGSLTRVVADAVFSFKVGGASKATETQVTIAPGAGKQP